MVRVNGFVLLGYRGWVYSVGYLSLIIVSLACLLSLIIFL